MARKRSFAQVDISLVGQGYGRTESMWRAIMQVALEEIDTNGADEAVVVVLRPRELGNIRITFKKEPESEGNQITQSIVDDPHIVDFPNG